MSEELKECPFCGSEAEYRQDLSEESDQYGDHVIMCSECLGGNSSNTKEDAISEWNTRTPPVDSGKVEAISEIDEIIAILDMRHEKAITRVHGMWVRSELTKIRNTLEGK
jgi:Lar family restriction alleviation protein